MVDNPEAMDGERKPLRVDAERNRGRLIAAATEMFCERGLTSGSARSPSRRGRTRNVVRNFPTKEHLIAAIVVERMGELAGRGATG